MSDRIVVILLMGVAGSGKSTVGARLADALGWVFHDGDRYHPAENIAKMTAGIPLDDADRWPWLERLRGLIDEGVATGRPLVLACSALKEGYRALLLDGVAGALIVHLTGSEALLAERLSTRSAHFMKPGMLASQLSTLEPPANAFTVDVADDIDGIVARIVARVMG